MSQAAAVVDDDRAVVLRLDDVHAGYGPFHALFGVSLDIHTAEALALIGPNGAGKTTVARVASGLLAPSEGRIEVNGKDFSHRPAQAFAAAGIAHAPEGRSVFGSLNVEENLTLPFRRQFGRAGLRPALDRAYELFPMLGQRRRQNAGSLSGGEQRMLTLARVLVLEPKLLIADELSLGLAPIVTTEIYRVLERILQAGTALLVVEQHIDHALALAEQTVVLERGKVVIAGHPSREEILASVFGQGEETSVFGQSEMNT
jgi:branched-chain amino acid transport system ATP-binding protein